MQVPLTLQANLSILEGLRAHGLPETMDMIHCLHEMAAIFDHVQADHLYITLTAELEHKQGTFSETPAHLSSQKPTSRKMQSKRAIDCCL